MIEKFCWIVCRIIFIGMYLFFNIWIYNRKKLGMLSYIIKLNIYNYIILVICLKLILMGFFFFDYLIYKYLFWDVFKNINICLIVVFFKYFINNVV